MRRFLGLLSAVFLIIALSVGVSAATGASKSESFATVSADGSCQVSMTVTIHLEQAMDKLYFPVPEEATGITLNGSRVSAARSDGARQVNLSRLVKGVVGDVTVNIHYSLYDVIHATDVGTLEMRVPLLSGFRYPVEQLNFSVTLPGEVTTLPSFVSGYHQARIEESLSYMVENATVSGSSIKAMKDHETLMMHLVVSPEMFPQDIAHTQDYTLGETAMGICAALALVIWVITLWNLPRLPKVTAEPPEGMHAGQLGCVAAGRGTDLTMMLLSWAQMGYVLLQVDRRNRVLVHRLMDMGNERSDFEQRCFGKLFGKRQVVDSASLHYVQLQQVVAHRTDGMTELFHRRTGNPKVFRAVASGIGLFGGACLAVALAEGAALQGFLIVLLGALGAVSGWQIQSFGAGILIGHRRSLQTSLALSAAWLLLGLIAGAFPVALKMVGALLAAGLLLAWGGRRTALGKQTQAQVFGLQHYLRTVDKQQLQSLCETDPEYFFRMAPCALALGVDLAFAKRFGNRKLEHCPYLSVGSQAPMSAQQWSKLLRKTVNAMNDRLEKLPLEKFLGIIHSLLKR